MQPDTPAPLDVLVRGICACGRRFRIRNARPDVIVQCPACGRPIPISITDIRAALGDEHIIPLQHDSAQPREALLIDHGVLRPAPAGSRVGSTGRMIENHEEALLMNALRGWRPKDLERRGRLSPARRGRAAALLFEEFTQRSRPFAADLLASFYFAGCARNGLNILLTAIACSLPAFIAGMVGFPFSLLLTPLTGIVFVYQLWFLWSVLELTAFGEDEIPWISSGASSSFELLWPVFANAVVACVCAMPYFVIRAFFARNPDFEVMAGLAILLGAWMWPGLMMAVAIGGLSMLLRPDLLAMTVTSMGLRYALAWVAVLAALGGSFGLDYAADAIRAQLGASVLDLLISGSLSLTVFLSSFYFGYVLYRTMGLLYRHFQSRFAWAW